MKLRLHLKELKDDMGDLFAEEANEHQSEYFNDRRMDADDPLKSDEDGAEPCTEEDIVGKKQKIIPTTNYSNY